MIDYVDNAISNIEKIFYYEDLKYLTRYIQNQKERITENNWKKMYYDRCEDNFMSLRKIIEEIWSKNWLSIEIEELEEIFLRTKDSVHIIDLMNFLKDRKLIYPNNLQKMTCAACACNNCEFLKEHLGYTCEECKKDYLTGYQGYCDE